MTAGFVNAEGYLGFSILTTNVTGHAALFAEKIAFQDWGTARVIALWMMLFLAGAFISGLILSLTDHNQELRDRLVQFAGSVNNLLSIVVLSVSQQGILMNENINSGSTVFKQLFGRNT